MLNDSAQRVPTVAVLGNHHGETNFVRHVALIAPRAITLSGDPPQIEYGDVIEISKTKRNPHNVVHVTVDGFVINNRILPCVLAWLDGLDAEQSMKALITVINMMLCISHPPITWTAHTPSTVLADRVLKDIQTNKEIGWSFSCAGFILWCYKRMTGIELLVDDDQLPPVPLELLWEPYAFGAIEEHSLDDELMSMNLIGRGPWRIALPGYLLHSLKRRSDEVRTAPYVPTIGDACFPSQM
jgi:hypothetical protein